MENFIEKTSKYHYAEPFANDGCFIVAMDECMGLVDKEGNFLIPMSMDFSTILDRYILACLCLYDSSGKFLTKVDRGTANVGSVGDYLYYRNNGDLFLMDSSNSPIPVHTSLKEYNLYGCLGDGFFSVYKKNTEKNYIDYGIITINELVVPCNYESVRKKDGTIIVDSECGVYSFDPTARKLVLLSGEHQEDLVKQNGEMSKRNLCRIFVVALLFMVLAICVFLF